jgi:fatty acid desaturase
LFGAGLWWVAALWYGSLVTAFMMFFRLRLWLEHQGSDLAHRLDLNPWEGALLAPHLAWHHWEHHQFPAVPYWKLPALRRLVPDQPLDDVVIGDRILQGLSRRAVRASAAHVSSRP